MHSHEVHWLQKVFTQVILEGRRQITILQSLPGFDINPWDYNDSIHPSSHFFYPSHLGFYHSWYNPELEVA